MISLGGEPAPKKVLVLGGSAPENKTPAPKTSEPERSELKPQGCPQLQIALFYLTPLQSVDAITQQVASVEISVKPEKPKEKTQETAVEDEEEAGDVSAFI